MEYELSPEQLDKYPAELRSVVQRHGPAMLEFCLCVAGTNRAVDQMLGFGQRFAAMQAPAMVVLDNMSTMCNVILRLKGWSMDQVTECIGDIGRAQAIAAGTPGSLLN